LAQNQKIAIKYQLTLKQNDFKKTPFNAYFSVYFNFTMQYYEAEGTFEQIMIQS
jgi:hypothetical protein